MSIIGLSGLRGLAMIIIVYYHLHQVRSTDSLALWDWALYQFTALLPVVVCVFFILGGFLRSLSYWKVIYEDREIPSFSKGLKDRLLRIAPLYYIALVLSSLWMFYLGTFDGRSFLVGFTFFSWVSPDTFFPAAKNGPLWFVAYDMMGNILVMIFMTLFLRLRYKILKYRERATILSFAGGFILLIALHYIFISLPWSQGSGVVGDWFPYYNPFIFNIQYLMGAAIGGIYYRYKDIAPSLFGDIIFGVSIFSITYFLLSILGASDLAYSIPKSPYRFPFVSLFLSLSILSLLFAQHVPRWLDNKFFLFIAGISYPLYLTHALIIDILRHLVFGYAPMVHGKWELFSCSVIVLSILVAWGLMKVESFFMKKMKK